MINRQVTWQNARKMMGACLLTTAFSSSAFAAFPDITGTYSGADTYSSTSCTNPADNETNTPGTFSLSISSQSGASFSGVINGVDQLTTNISGTLLNPDGDFTGTFSNAEETGAFNGSFDVASGTGTINYSGTNSVTGCIFSGNGTLTGGTFAPSTAPSTALTTQQTLSTTISSFTTAITQRITTLRQGNNNGGIKVGPQGKNGFNAHGATGLSSGDEFDGVVGVWGSFSHSQSEDDFSSTAFESKRNSMVFGIDLSPDDDFVIGMAVAYEDNDIDTEFNGGHVDSSGFSMMGYGAYSIDETYSIDVLAGVSNINIDQYRTISGSPTRITSATDADRLFISAHFNAGKTYGDWFVTGRTGFLWATERQEAFLESNGSLIDKQLFGIGQLRAGADFIYQTNGDWEPYGSLMLEYDYRRTAIAVADGSPQPTLDRTGGILGLGVRYYAKNGMTGNVEYSTVLGRENYSEHTLNMTLRSEF